MPHVEFGLPIKGLNEGLPVSVEQRGFSEYMLNVRPRDVLDGRLRVGQRPGMKKAYAQQIGGTASPIMWLGEITIVN